MNNETNKILPELRFPEFENEGEWRKKKLEAIGEPLMCKRIFKEQTTSNPKNGIPFYKIGTFGQEPDSYISQELYEEYKSKYSFPKIGDILISASGTIGRLVIYDGSPAFFQDSNIVWLGNNEEIVLNSFLFYCYSSLKWQTSDGGIISRLYNSDLKNMTIFFPQGKIEQQKIADCLTSLDEVITAHSQQLEALKEHKKGLMQNLFPQEGETVPKWRFPEFLEDGEWEEKSFEELFEIGNGRDYKHLDKGKIPVYGSGGYMLSVNDYLYDGESVCIGRKGTIDKPMFLSGKFWTVDTLFYTHSFKDCLPKYIYYVFQNTNWLNHNEAGGIPSLSKTNIYKIKALIPKPNEQQKIANFLSSLDELIIVQAEKIEQLKLHKKGLMQRLFPKATD
ncbi:restriction endonuclease subunit S [Larkinella punicea]|uniref:Restriction endonuclease subunit S n=1 Tax=Larkinella punicea TaxID=2315727 RepID=A0A368JR70_9BACT|nr:restriction endonuclease subunit S [Larkinella punicea]RCR70128.1 restriction endonuclease subunit S [Larkinella punicea]